MNTCVQNRERAMSQNRCAFFFFSFLFSELFTSVFFFNFKVAFNKKLTTIVSGQNDQSALGTD